MIQKSKYCIVCFSFAYLSFVEDFLRLGQEEKIPIKNPDRN